MPSVAGDKRTSDKESTMNKKTTITKGVAGGCAIAVLSMSMLSGCGNTGSGTVATDTGSATSTAPVATDDHADATDSETGGAVTSGDTITGTTGSGGTGASRTESPAGESGGTQTASVSDVTEVSAYATKVGYFPETEEGTVFIKDADAWSDYVSSVSRVTYSDDGETATHPTGLKEYSREFFTKGNRLLVRYQNLPTGSANPKVTSWSIDGDSVIVEWDDGIADDMVTTTDMSGFVIVAEIPAGGNLTQIKFAESM